MKKHFLEKFLLAFMALFAGVDLTACGDNENNEPVVTPDSWSSEYVIKVSFSEDYLKIAHITAHIAHPDGSLSSEEVTKATTTWTLKGVKLPDRAGVMLTFSPKDNILTDEVYELSYDASISASSLVNGGVFSYKSDSMNTSLTVKGDRIAEYLEKEEIILAKGINKNGGVINISSSDINFGADTTQE